MDMSDGPTLAIVPEIPDDASERKKEGMVRRRMVAMGQPCPCGAQPPRLNRAQRRAATKGGVIHVYIEHESGCPAVE